MNIALIAHDAKKELLVQFCIAYCGILSRHDVCATGTTGKLVEEATGLEINCFLSGVQGGGHKDHEEQQSAPAAPSPAGSLCHVTIRSLPPGHHHRRRFPQMIYIMLVHYKTHRGKTQEENGVPRTGTPFFRTVRSPPARPPAPAAAAAS